MDFLKDLGSSLLGGIPSIIGNVFGAFSNSSTNKANKEINQMNNEFNERMMDKQIAYEKEMWEKNNEYNSASAQAERWREAGFNPTMMMGNANAGVATSGSVGAASAAPSAPQQAFKPDVSSFVDTIVAMQDLQIKDRVADAEVQQLNSIAEKNRAEALEALERVTDWKNKNKLPFWQIQYDHLNSEIGRNRAQESYTNALESYQLLVNNSVPEDLASKISLNHALADEAKFNSQTELGKMIDDYERKTKTKLPEEAIMAIFGLHNLAEFGGKVVNLRPKNIKNTFNTYDSSRHYQTNHINNGK